MAHSKLKLTYFDVMGKGELCRLVMTLGGKEFEDNRLDMHKDWPKVKPTTPFGQLPVLEIDGKAYAQCLAIANFLAREFDLYGKNNIERLKIDQTMQLWDEFFSLHFSQFMRAPEVNRPEILKTLKAEQFPKYLGFFEKLLKESGTGYIAGDKLSLADIAVFDFCTGHLKPFVNDMLDQYPFVKSMTQKVSSIPRIKAYLAKRK